MAKTDYASIDDYINTFPVEIQERLEKIRRTIRKTAPEAKEVISYQMPTFRLRGILVHFAAFSHHISLFPSPSAIKAFGKKLASFETSKGTIKFPNDRPIPFDLISKIVTFRVQENSEKQKNHK